ncbi:hypothetical protein [Sphingopyxis sp.]|uniref:hypothetical protein n=1 Tax=Sphingopyxis sp. TaxID=1908224 RepID=UPI001D7B8551|nr:hypothetical protein [Sphingopyxis sp.]MBW8295128.1 hypothetical protein [Sphingopyxis sp.]
MTWRLAVTIGLALANPASSRDANNGLPISGASESSILIPAGTIIDLVTTNTVSSKKSVKGDLLYLKVASPLIVDGIVAIPADTIVVGQLSQADQRGAFGKKGRLEVQFLYAELPGGTVRISGALEARGKGGADDAAATAAAFLLLPFVATGRSAEIPAGSQVSGRLDRDLFIDRH